MKAFKLFNYNNSFVIQILLFIFVFFIKSLHSSNLVDNETVNYLNKESKKNFLLKCHIDNNYIENANCLNFLGMNIYVSFYIQFNKGSISKEVFFEMENKALDILQVAIKKGSKNAIKNIAWIYSNEVSKFHNLEKSSESYGTYLKEKNKNYESNMVAKKSKKKMPTQKKNYYNLELALALMELIKIYYEHSEKSEYVYVSVIDYKQAQALIIDLINKSKISEVDLKLLKQKVFNNNAIIVSFLKADLESNDKKFIADAKKDLNKLKSISKSLN